MVILLFALIGKKGVVIKKIIEETGVTVDIDDNGLVTLMSPDLDSLNKIDLEIDGNKIENKKQPLRFLYQRV